MATRIVLFLMVLRHNAFSPMRTKGAPGGVLMVHVVTGRGFVFRHLERCGIGHSSGMTNSEVRDCVVPPEQCEIPLCRFSKSARTALPRPPCAVSRWRPSK